MKLYILYNVHNVVVCDNLLSKGKNNEKINKSLGCFMFL